MAGLAINDAHHGRLIGVSLPGFGGTVFEDLHGAADDAAFGQRLRRLTASHFGLASRYFLRRVVECRAREEAGLLERLGKWRAFYLRQASTIDTHGRQLDRVHEKICAPVGFWR